MGQGMKSEKRHEARERFMKLREIEEQGALESSEGQLRPQTLSELKEEDPEFAERYERLNAEGVSATSDDAEDESSSRARESKAITRRSVSGEAGGDKSVDRSTTRATTTSSGRSST